MRVFITGASSGIGAAMAKKFDAMGAQLGLVGRSQEKLDAVLSSMQNAQAHTTYALDVTDRAALFAAARDFDGKAPVDIVLANAGTSIGVKTEYEEDLDVLEKVYRTNVFAMAATFHPFIEPMSKRGGGQFAGIGSVGGIRGLGKVEKVYLDNPNLIYALAESESDTGSLRETFFLNQTRVRNQVTSSAISDFRIGDRTFETGGKSKGRRQLASAEEGYIVKDGIEFSSGNILPLWRFGINY